MKTIEERLVKLEDETAIRNLAARFADSATNANYGALKLLWKSDGVFTINHPANVIKNGIDDIVSHIMSLRDTKDFFVQFVHSGVMEINGDKATARWTMHEVGQGPGEKYYSTYGIFSDEMEKIDGQWLFKSRVYDYIWLDFNKFGGQTFKLPEYN